jgi:hypothetical protein
LPFSLIPALHPVSVNGVNGGGWKGEAVRYGGWNTEFISEVVEETRLVNEWESEDAVDCSCDCMLPMLLRLLVPSDLDCASDWGLVSVFSRRSIPLIAYETGYVKYEDERLGVDRCDGGDVCEGGERYGGDEGGSVEGMDGN